MAIAPGDVFWVQGETRIRHPYVVIEMDEMVTACAVTSNVRKISLPGNVLLEVGEANLTRPSVVEVSKRVTLHINQLGDPIGTLSSRRVAQIRAGIQFVERSFF